MDKDTALDLALEALEYIENNYMSLPKSGSEAITAIKQARSAPVQEPVAFNASVPPLYPEMKDGETISVEYTTPPGGRQSEDCLTAAQEDIQRLSALVRAQQITIDKLEQACSAPVQEPEHIVHSNGRYSPLLTRMMNKRVESNVKQVIHLYDEPPAAPVQEPVQLTIPEGMVLVPYEPSTEMQEQGSTAAGYDLSQKRARHVYQSMIDMHVLREGKQARSAPVHEPVAHCEAGPEYCQQCHLEDRSLALAAAVRYVKNNTPKLVSDEICMALASITAAQPAPVQEPVWIQPDHLQKAQKAPFLCRVEPHKRDDFVPLYTTPPAAQRQCKWPTCQSEEYQQALAEQIKQELVTGAAQRQWVGLTDEEREGILDREFRQWWSRHDAVCRAIEAKLKEKNT